MCKYKALNHVLDKDHADVLTALSLFRSHQLKRLIENPAEKVPSTSSATKYYKHDENAQENN